MGIQAIIVDTAGTTTDFSFIKEVLFQYSAEALPTFLQEHHNDFTVAALLQDVRRISNQNNADLAQITSLLLEWIEHDNKATPLKTLQGLIWQQGYLKGDYQGHIFADAATALQQWQQQGKRLYSYSSSSADAQELLFRYSEQGDLSNLFYGHFDTNLGQKKTVQAYKNILNTISLWPRQVLFVSDDLEELNAAAEAGIQTLQMVRKDGLFTGKHSVHNSFDTIKL
ncbi:acireductone synthase [Ferrimonas lipolytica]|uniref:Enolase-phosphatase E1 n=1 Tax=Ferrimonas lipolytica TaxID=2724191 RepID=A0A6H1UIV5_9GAMM|nr:acireductone synthase [Ferrimonas lipolytica]QIZ78243.1 acireductone synthase [Ferrimonas lipolytica]